MLFNLLAVTGRDIFAPAVISLTGNGPVGERIAALGIPVHVLGMRRDRPEPFHWWLLGRLLKRSCPDLVQTWMYHADLLGGMAARAFTAAPVVWGLHNNLSEPGAARAVLIRQFDEHGRLKLVASQTGPGEPLTDAALWRAFRAMPVMTYKVLFAIHWQALKIWLRGARFFPKPQPPEQEVT